MRWFIIFLVLTFSAAVEAQDPPILTLPPGDDLIVQLKKGEPVPFDGQHFSIDTSIRWGFWLQQYKLRLKEDVAKERRTCKFQLDFKDKELKIEKKRAATVEKDLFARVLKSEKLVLKWQDKAMNPSFFKTFEFGVLVSFVVIGATTGLLAWGLNKK